MNKITVASKNGVSNLEVSHDLEGDVSIIFGWEIKTFDLTTADKLAKALTKTVRSAKWHIKTKMGAKPKPGAHGSEASRPAEGAL